MALARVAMLESNALCFKGGCSTLVILSLRKKSCKRGFFAGVLYICGEMYVDLYFGQFLTIFEPFQSHLKAMLV